MRSGGFSYVVSLNQRRCRAVPVPLSWCFHTDVLRFPHRCPAVSPPMFLPFQRRFFPSSFMLQSYEKYFNYANIFTIILYCIFIYFIIKHS